MSKNVNFEVDTRDEDPKLETGTGHCIPEAVGEGTVRESIGETLKRLRKEHGLTQAKLGELTGINPKTIEKYEIGDRNPGVNRLLQLSSFYGISIFEILKLGDGYSVGDVRAIILEMVKNGQAAVVKHKDLYSLEFKDEALSDALKKWYTAYAEHEKMLQDAEIVSNAQSKNVLRDEAEKYLAENLK